METTPGKDEAVLSDGIKTKNYLLLNITKKIALLKLLKANIFIEGL